MNKRYKIITLYILLILFLRVGYVILFNNQLNLVNAYTLSSLTTINSNNINSKNTNKNKVIVIDPGHACKTLLEKEPIAPNSKIMKPKNVIGAVGIVTKTPEYVINLKVSLKLKKYLTDAGYKVIMTRTTNSKVISNIERAEIGNKNNADLVIRIHADSSNDKSMKGASMLVPGDVGYAKKISNISRKYGEILLNRVIKEVGMENRGVITREDLTGFNWSKVPVVLIEMGYLSNPSEDRLLSSEKYQDKIARALFKGVEEIFKNKN
ncbi:N-acetylmuramoyl-L-alanine amidase family protein [Thermobrachium celere]|uniref:N-acetylmuramoyl-L-alanine amidase family protein n=1 Tax=Thermobrachium celere TaxID=53422 RepID=UPI001A646FC0|nr:N-acetylmuramoyl-L-alanine amidase [Thermobrachium celere]GFR35736.1 hypothetical protein TCEA9_15480 [Thermobrachium celere]